MSETMCIHGIPVDPWYIHCDKCQRMFDPTLSPLPPGRTVDPEEEGTKMTTVMEPFNRMDMWQQNDHMDRVHKFEVGPPMLDGMTQQHARHHAMNLDLDHSHDHPLPWVRTVDPDRLAESWREEEQLRNDLPEETGE